MEDVHPLSVRTAEWTPLIKISLVKAPKWGLLGYFEQTSILYYMSRSLVRSPERTRSTELYARLLIQLLGGSLGAALKTNGT